MSWLTQAVPESPQEDPSGSVFARQAPDPSQLSGLSQDEAEELPQAVPEDLKPLSTHTPAAQVSWFTQALPASPQNEPFGRSLLLQAPEPLQESGAVHPVEAGLPQAVPWDV